LARLKNATSALSDRLLSINACKKQILSAAARDLTGIGAIVAFSFLRINAEE
jgi:hypothetical protein